MKAKKVNKPAFIVDITGVETLDDVKFAFISAKINADIALNSDEVVFAVNYPTRSKTVKLINTPELKTPWYKKLWNLVKQLFNKNK